MSNINRLIGAALSISLFSIPAWSAPPNAGTTLQNVEGSKLEIPVPHAPVLDVQSGKARPVFQDSSTKIPVREFRLTGVTQFNSSEVDALLADEAGKELTLADIDLLAARITNFYRGEGYFLATAYIPAQDIKNGSVEIAVLEGKYGAVKVQNNSLVAFPPLNVNAGEVVSLPSLERSLLLLNDLPGIVAKSTLRPGASLGTSDLIVELTEGKPFTGNIEVDNYGSRYTGSNRLGATLNINNPAGLGDVLTLRGMTGGKGLAYGRASYQVPVNSYGTKAGLAYSDMRYELGKDFSALDARGSARIQTAYVAHPLIRSRETNLNIQLSYDSKDIQDRIDSTDVVTDKDINVLSFGLSGDRRDGWLGGGSNAFQATLTQGRLSIDTPIAKGVDEITARTDGKFQKLNLTLMRLQGITSNAALYLSYSGQWANTNLDSSEKFVAGGALGVRAYPSGEAPGDEGNLLTVELRYLLPAGFQAVGFIDAARIKINKQQWPAATGRNTRELSGAGIGLHWAGTQGISFRAYYAHKLSSAEATSENDKNGRLWAQAIYSF